MKWTKMKKESSLKIKAPSSWLWDSFSIEIKSVVFNDNFHLIVTFRDGTIKDINALDFINDEEIKNDFDEIRNNIELFKHPISVSNTGIMWTDLADISAATLWNLGKTVKIASIKKVSFAKIKDLKKSKLILVSRSDEKRYENTPHFHLYDKNVEIGEIAVEGPNVEIDKCKKGYKQNFNQARKYIDNNKNLLIQIYNAKDGNEKKKLSDLLPEE